MKKVLSSMVCLSLACLVAVATGGEKTAKIEGTWIATGAISEGKKVPEDVVAKLMLTVTLKDGKYRVTIQDKEVEAGSYKADEATKHLDLTIAKGKDEGKTQLGINQNTADDMTVALADAGR